MNKQLLIPPEMKINLQAKPDKGLILKLAGCAAAGFCLAHLDSMGQLSPFAVSFVCGVPFDYCFCAFVGSCIGYFVSSGWQLALKYTFALLIASVFRLVVLRRYQTENNSFVCSLLAFCSCCIASIVY